MSFYHLEMANSHPIVKCFIKSCPHLLQARVINKEKNPKESLAKDEPSGPSSRGKLNLNRKRALLQRQKLTWYQSPLMPGVLVRPARG